MTAPDRVRRLVEPIVEQAGLGLYDLELAGAVLRVVVDRPTGDPDAGLGLDALTDLTRSISRALDDDDPIAGRFTLEVSSPGLERALRTPAHFAAAVGEVVAVKTIPGLEGERRVRGTLESADDDGIVIADPTAGGSRRLAYDEVERARTVFEWGPPPKPGGPRQTRTKRSRKKHPEQKQVTAS
jgi:ribosome maturation factor RimP